MSREFESVSLSVCVCLCACAGWETAHSIISAACIPDRIALLSISLISGHVEVEAANDISCFIRSWRSRRSVPCLGDLPVWGNNLRPRKLQHHMLPSSIFITELCRYTYENTVYTFIRLMLRAWKGLRSLWSNEGTMSTDLCWFLIVPVHLAFYLHHCKGSFASKKCTVKMNTEALITFYCNNTRAKCVGLSSRYYLTFLKALMKDCRAFSWYLCCSPIQ